jgi:hypothetical protein
MEEEQVEDDQQYRHGDDEEEEEREPPPQQQPQTLDVDRLEPAGILPSPTHSGQLSQKEVKILETAEDIQDRREQVLGRYSAFKTEVKLKREKLEDSRRFQYFKRDADELESWIYEKLQAASSDEGFKDVSNLQAKIQKHQVGNFAIATVFFPGCQGDFLSRTFLP